MTERLLIILSGLFVIVAATFLWRNNFSAAFVTGTLGAVAWLLSYRIRLLGTPTVSENSAEEDNKDDED